MIIIVSLVAVINISYAQARHDPAVTVCSSLPMIGSRNFPTTENRSPLTTCWVTEMIACWRAHVLILSTITGILIKSLRCTGL